MILVLEEFLNVFLKLVNLKQLMVEYFLDKLLNFVGPLEEKFFLVNSTFIKINLNEKLII